MLKRSIAIMLMMLYIATVSGFALNLHYCFNRLSSVTVDVPASACAKDLQISKMKCCKDRHVEIKVKDAHQAGPSPVLAKLLTFDVPKLSFAGFSLTPQTDLPWKPADRGPPLQPGTSIFIKNCTFRI